MSTQDFNRDHIENFLAIVRKYMSLRNNLSQKDLADMTGVGVSTLSRFLNQKTQVLDEQVIARIVAKLNIPLHEMIDFIHESYEAKFVRLVKFYKDQTETDKIGVDNGEENGDGEMGSARIETKAQVKIGNGPTRTIPFAPEDQNKRMKSEVPISEKLQSLSPRQKAYLSSFLDLDMEGRDLIVDLGNSLFNYFKQKGLEF